MSGHSPGLFPHAERIREACLALPGAWEDTPWDHVAFKVGKSIFAIFGESGVTIKASLDEQAALIQDPRIEVAPYVGRYGWVWMRVETADDAEFACELCTRAHASLGRKSKTRSGT